MEQEFRSKLTGKLRGLSIYKMMPDFDADEIWEDISRKLDAEEPLTEAVKEQEWQELSEQLASIPDFNDELIWNESTPARHTKIRLRPLPLPIRYAAGLAAVVFITGFLVRSLSGQQQITIAVSKPKDSMHVVTHIARIAPPIDSGAALDKKTLSLTPEPVLVVKKTQPQQVRPDEKLIIDTTGIVSNKQQDVPPEPFVNSPEPIVQVQAPPVRAMHLNDMKKPRNRPDAAPVVTTKGHSRGQANKSVLGSTL